MELSAFFSKSSGLVYDMVLKYTFISLALSDPLVLFGFSDSNYRSVIDGVLWSVFVPRFLEENGIVCGPLHQVYDGILNFIDISGVFGRDIEVMIVELADGLHCTMTFKIPCSVLEKKIVVLHKGVLLIRAGSFGFYERETAVLVCSLLNICLRSGVVAFDDLKKIKVCFEGNKYYEDMSMMECMVNWHNVIKAT